MKSLKFLPANIFLLKGILRNPHKHPVSDKKSLANGSSHTFRVTRWTAVKKFMASVTADFLLNNLLLFSSIEFLCYLKISFAPYIDV